MLRLLPRKLPPSPAPRLVRRSAPPSCRHVSSAASSSSSARSPLSTLALAGLGVLFGTSTYFFGALNPPEAVRLINPPSAPPSPAVDTLEGRAVTEGVERGLQELPEVKQLRALGIEHWVESRPYRSYREDKRVHHLTAGVLRGPGKLAVPPLVFSRPDDSESIIFIHLGRSLCGHDGIVHGGLLATLSDESLARTAILALPHQVGVTASLNLSYKNPTMADQYVVFRSKLARTEGRKAWANGSLETVDGKVLLKAESLFVEPKGAAFLDAGTVKEILGVQDKK